MKKILFSIIMVLAVCFFMNNSAFADNGKEELNHYTGVLYTCDGASPVKFANASPEEFQAQIELLMAKEAPGAVLIVDVSGMTIDKVGNMVDSLTKKGEFYTRWSFCLNGDEPLTIKVVKI